MKRAVSKKPDWFPELTADITLCEQHLQGEHSAFWRRAYIRTAFSVIEAINELLREKALAAACAGGKDSVNISRIELLGNTKYRIAKNGILEADNLRAPFVHYTAFILRSLAEESGVAVTFFADDGWNRFQKAVAIRNRLTHPKRHEDVLVSDADIQTVHDAIRWHMNSCIAAFNNPRFWKSVNDSETQPND